MGGSGNCHAKNARETLAASALFSIGKNSFSTTRRRKTGAVGRPQPRVVVFGQCRGKLMCEIAWFQQVRDGRHEHWLAIVPLLGRNREVDVVALFICRQINNQRVGTIFPVGIVQGRLWNHAGSGCSGTTCRLPSWFAGQIDADYIPPC